METIVLKIKNHQKIRGRKQILQKQMKKLLKLRTQRMKQHHLRVKVAKMPLRMMKKKKFITVQKEKKRVHKKALTVKTYHVGRIQPYSESTLEESKAKLALLAAKDKALQELEEMKNKLESYIYYIKNKLSDKEEEIAKVSTEEQRT